MAGFCKYCGKPITGAACTCPQAVAEARNQAAAAQRQAAPGQQVQGGQVQYQQVQYQQVPNQQAPRQQAVTFSPQAQDMLTETKNLALGLFTSPAETLQRAMTSTSKIPQVIIGGVASLLLLIAVWIIYWDDTFELGFGAVILTTLLAVALRVCCGIVGALFARKHNPSLSIGSAACMSWMTELIDAGIILLTMLMVKISLGELVIALLFFWIMETVIVNYLLVSVMSLNSAKMTYIVNIVMQLVLMIVIVFFLLRSPVNEDFVTAIVKILSMVNI